MKPSGEFLISDFNKGDKRAFAAVYNLYYSSVFYLANKYLNDRQDALDITAESFIKLLQCKTEFKSAEHLKSYLFTITRNTSIDHLRKAQRRTEHEKEFSYVSEVGAFSFDHELYEIEAEVYERLIMAIEKLPEKCRNIFKLLLQGMSTDEIARRFNISVHTVWAQKARALELLRKYAFKNRLVNILVLATSLLNLPGK